MAIASATKCPFCRPDPERVFHVGPLVLGIWDAFPVSPGHALLVPKRHVSSWFEATPEECGALLSAADLARELIEKKRAPDGYNIGINVGEAAGQTVGHLHVHVIPRYLGDVIDPRGGVRHVIPARGNYLEDDAMVGERASSAASGGTTEQITTQRHPSAPPVVGQEYSRAEIPLTFGLEPSVAFRSQALFAVGSKLFLIVTLRDNAESGGNSTAFVAPDVLEWHARGGKHADLLVGGVAGAIVAEIFVRKTSKSSGGTVPYTYCGEAELDEHLSEQPLVVRWKLHAGVPEQLR
jgi:diadenosine tetraphosphate (Ap4A) HIT family hydrolase